MEDNGVQNDFELRADFYYTMDELREYGYTKDDMYPINKQRAEHFLELGLPVYLLYSDNEKTPVTKVLDVPMFEGLIGIQKSEWEKFLQTDKGAIFAYAWDCVSNAAQGVRIDKELQYGAFTGVYYELLYGEETSCLENYFDERYELKGDMPDELTDVLINRRIYVRLMFEYAERLKEMFSDSEIEELNSTVFLIDLIDEVSKRYTWRT